MTRCVTTDGYSGTHCHTTKQAVRTTRSHSENRVWEHRLVAIGKDVRQGCILSPYLFKLYSENIMRSAGLENNPAGVKIGGEKYNNLRYADDTTLLAESEEGLKRLQMKVKEKSKETGLYLNIKKTKVVTTEDLNEIEIGNKEVEIVYEFNYLGVLIE